MIQPRNTLVLLRLKDAAQRQVGAITVPTNGEQFTQAEVVAVGPGNVAAEGGISDTFDLKPGQRVLVIHKDRAPQRGLSLAGIPVQENGETLHLYEQARILAVLTGEEKSDPSLILHA